MPVGAEAPTYKYPVGRYLQVRHERSKKTKIDFLTIKSIHQSQLPMARKPQLSKTKSLQIRQLAGQFGIYKPAAFVGAEATDLRDDGQL
jgi:hypothetical protein